jgi:hypothetical protein
MQSIALLFGATVILTVSLAYFVQALCNYSPYQWRNAAKEQTLLKEDIGKFVESWSCSIVYII